MCGQNKNVWLLSSFCAWWGKQKWDFSVSQYIVYFWKPWLKRRAIHFRGPNKGKGELTQSGFQVLLSLVLQVKGFYGTSISTQPVVSLWLLTSQLKITSKANKIPTLLIKQLLATEIFGAQALHWLWSVCYNLMESTITNLQKILSKNNKTIKEIILPKLTIIFWDCIMLKGLYRNRAVVYNFVNTPYPL